MKLELVAMGVTPEQAEPLAECLRLLLGVAKAQVVVKKLPETGDVWRHVYAPVRKAVLAHALVAAWKSGVEFGSRR